MNKFSLVKKLLLLFSVVFFASCDKDFNTIGSDIVGDDYFDFQRHEFNGLTAFDSITGPVQSNNLTLNSLGVYDNPAFGVGTSHFVTQAELQVTNVTVGANPTIDSVWVYVPHFSKQTGTTTEGVRTYELDSVYGGEQRFGLKIYENGYYLNDYNPDNTNGVQRHFSNEKSKVETRLLGSDGSGNSVLNGSPLNNGLSNENTDFSFNASERIIYKTNGNGLYVDAAGVVLPTAQQGDLTKRVVKERFAPGLWINLNKDYFRKRILEAPASKLANNNAFKEYFRGLYFQAEANSSPSDPPGAMAMFDFSKGYIRISYKVDGSGTTPRIKKTLTLKLTGNTVNFFDTNYALPSDNATDKRLYLKGGNGSMAFINVFGDDTSADGVNNPDELVRLKEKGWMINEANLTFYVDKTAMAGVDGLVEPDRIYLYDAKNKRPIIDYYADGSTNGINPKLNKRGFGGIIEREAVTKKAIKYKIRLTEYLKACLEKDSTNFKLGLVVSENINNSSNAYLLPTAVGLQPKRVVPLSSVISPLGTILYGPGIIEGDANYDKRLKLEIYYTKPD
jgi:uncharacterized protein DUF4270